uniref:Uncharacterized protein n=1 Tax=Heterorhabditis bacteriophora TaxID=37862 RepID=A0A1I7WQR5_HETBA
MYVPTECLSTRYQITLHALELYQCETHKWHFTGNFKRNSCILY